MPTDHERKLQEWRQARKRLQAAGHAYREAMERLMAGEGDEADVGACEAVLKQRRQEEQAAKQALLDGQGNTEGGPVGWP
jgi:hypothetical protein